MSISRMSSSSIASSRQLLAAQRNDISTLSARALVQARWKNVGITTGDEREYERSVPLHMRNGANEISEVEMREMVHAPRSLTTVDDDALVQDYVNHAPRIESGFSYTVRKRNGYRVLYVTVVPNNRIEIHTRFGTDNCSPSLVPDAQQFSFVIDTNTGTVIAEPVSNSPILLQEHEGANVMHATTRALSRLLPQITSAVSTYTKKLRQEQRALLAAQTSIGTNVRKAIRHTTMALDAID